MCLLLSLLAVVKLPARGLASGNPVEFLSGAYLGVRSLAINTISASYEGISGASGFMALAISSVLPEHKKKSFLDDVLAFQRTILDEVETLDAVEEGRRHMTKVIIRAPRVLTAGQLGILTEYGPGSLPQADQERVDLRAVLLIQEWYRRRRLMTALFLESARLRPEVVAEETKRCCIQ